MPHRRPGFTLVELLVVMAIIGILVGLLLPAIQYARESARRTQCANNMKQVGLSLHLFHDVHRVFPASGWTQAGPGNPAGKFVGWRPLILPYLEQQNVQTLYNFDLHWWEGTNPTVGSVPIPTFRCPSASARPEAMSAIAKPPRPAMTFSTPIAPTDYEAIMGVQPASINPHLPTPVYNSQNRFSAMYRNSLVKFADVVDGTSSTVMVVECGGRPEVYRKRVPNSSLSNDQGIGWVDSEGPFSLDGASADGSLEGCGPAAGCTQSMNRKNDNEPLSFHAGGGNFLFVDGRVQFLKDSLPLTTLAALCTADANEVVGSIGP